jgi:hypothetical protein
MSGAGRVDVGGMVYHARNRANFREVHRLGVRDKSVRVRRRGHGGSPSNPRICRSSDGSEER